MAQPMEFTGTTCIACGHPVRIHHRDEHGDVTACGYAPTIGVPCGCNEDAIANAAESPDVLSEV
jgi:hypothetical protein